MSALAASGPPGWPCGQPARLAVLPGRIAACSGSSAEGRFRSPGGRVDPRHPRGGPLAADDTAGHDPYRSGDSRRDRRRGGVHANTSAGRDPARSATRPGSAAPARHRAADGTLELAPVAPACRARRTLAARRSSSTPNHLHGAKSSPPVASAASLINRGHRLLGRWALDQRDYRAAVIHARSHVQIAIAKPPMPVPVTLAVNVRGIEGSRRTAKGSPPMPP